MNEIHLRVDYLRLYEKIYINVCILQLNCLKYIHNFSEVQPMNDNFLFFDVKDNVLFKIVIENCFSWFCFDTLDAFQQGLHDITVLETETATFECQLIDDSMEGERVWWYKGKKVEASNDKYASIENNFSDIYFFK